MNIAHGDSVFVAGPGGGTPGPEPALLRLLTIIERQDLAAEREHYLRDYLEYLVPYRWLELYPPASSSELDPRLQEDKLDFQKQNVRRFHIADSVLARGYVHVGGETIPFLRVTYRAGPDSKLWELAGRLGDHVKLWVRIGDIHTSEPIVVPYNPSSDCTRSNCGAGPLATWRRDLARRVARLLSAVDLSLGRTSSVDVWTRSVASASTASTLLKWQPKVSCTPCGRCRWRWRGQLKICAPGTLATDRITDTNSP